MLIGRDVDDVLKYERTLPSAREVLTGLSPAQADELTRQVRDRLVAYASPDGVTMPGAAWLVRTYAMAVAAIWWLTCGDAPALGCGFWLREPDGDG
jgi:hypothetical protein